MRPVEFGASKPIALAEVVDSTTKQTQTNTPDIAEAVAFMCTEIVSRWLARKFGHSERERIERRRMDAESLGILPAPGVNRNTKIGGEFAILAQDKTSLLNLFCLSTIRQFSRRVQYFAIDRPRGWIWPIVTVWDTAACAVLHYRTLSLSHFLHLKPFPIASEIGVLTMLFSSMVIS